MENLPGWKDLFAPGGKPLAEGDRLVQPALAATLACIAAEGAKGFYEGPVARDIARAVAASGGFLDEADLAAIRADLAPPLAAAYRGLRLYTQPPVSQGLVLLRALRLLEAAMPDARAKPRPEFWGAAARALRRAFDDRLRVMGDGPSARAAAEAIVDGRSEGTAAVRWQAASGNETSTLAIMDASGNSVSLIQSVYSELGSGVVAADSGVLLNNRMLGFHLDPAHPNALAPRRRTMHTLHCFIAEDGEGLRWVGGSPGADQQPQVNLQVLARLVDFAEPPADAVAAPRWAVTPGTRESDIAAAKGDAADCEPGVPEEVRQGLAAAGFAPVVRERYRAGSSKIVGRGRRPGELGAWACWRREGAVAAG
jgi:gamma-glutamyltranspeptidase/glutathione hydrolase